LFTSARKRTAICQPVDQLIAILQLLIFFSISSKRTHSPHHFHRKNRDAANNPLPSDASPQVSLHERRLTFSSRVGSVIKMITPNLDPITPGGLSSGTPVDRHPARTVPFIRRQGM
jgi:hypothetical protein